MITTCSIKQAQSDWPHSQRVTPVAVTSGVAVTGDVAVTAGGEDGFKGLATGGIAVAVEVGGGAGEAIFTTSGATGVEVGLEAGATSGVFPTAVGPARSSTVSGVRVGPAQADTSNRLSPINSALRNPFFLIKIIFKTKRGAIEAPQP
jgi:hypothetical protein